MNYYNPYFYNIPNSNMMMYQKVGLFKRLFNRINFNNVLNGTQRTLNIINQTIPLVKQAKPIIRNAKTMFKVMNEFKKVDTTVPTKTNISETKSSNFEGPKFFA